MPKCCLALCLPLHITTEHYNLTSNQSVWFEVYTDLLNTISSLSSTHTQSPFAPFQYLLPLLWPFTIQMLKLLFLFYFCILYLHDQLWKEYFDHVWIGHVGAIKINELYLWESSNYSWIFRLFFLLWSSLVLALGWKIFLWYICKASSILTVQLCKYSASSTLMNN